MTDEEFVKQFFPKSYSFRTLNFHHEEVCVVIIQTDFCAIKKTVDPIDSKAWEEAAAWIFIYIDEPLLNYLLR